MTQDSRNLRSILDDGPLRVARAIQIARDIARELARAHLEGVVHGSLKPSNIIVSPSGAVKITDYSIGQSGQAAPLDHRCDVFALGALFYEMLTHQPPGAEPLPPSELNQHVPRALDSIVLSMLAAQPADRMPGVPVLLRELERLEEGLGLEPGTNAVTDEPAPGDAFQNRPLTDSEEFDYRRALMARESRREQSSASWPIYAAVVVVLAAFGIGYAGFMYYSSDSKERVANASRIKEAPAASGATAPLPVAEVTKEPVPEVKAEPEKPGTLLGLKVPAKPPAAEARQADAAPAQELPRPKQATAKVPQLRPAGKAQLILSVSPGGEIYIDGEHHGTAPAATTFELEPGMHRVEVRSGSRKPYLTYMTVEAGDVRRIQHDFDAKPSRPPG